MSTRVSYYFEVDLVEPMALSQVNHRVLNREAFEMMLNVLLYTIYYRVAMVHVLFVATDLYSDTVTMPSMVYYLMPFSRLNIQLYNI